MIDNVPKRLDRAARGVGMHIPQYEETSRRKGVVGAQCSGRVGLNRSATYEAIS